MENTQEYNNDSKNQEDSEIGINIRKKIDLEKKEISRGKMKGKQRTTIPRKNRGNTENARNPIK